MAQTLKIVSIALVLVGGILAAITIVNFFQSFSSHRPPERLWLGFIGMPMLGIGLAIGKFAFLRPISRYVADELQPVGRDFVRGLRVPAAPERSAAQPCPSCKKPNDPDARFCVSCATELRRTCSSCSALCAIDARFCKHCGQACA